MLDAESAIRLRVTLSFGPRAPPWDAINPPPARLQLYPLVAAPPGAFHCAADWTGIAVANYGSGLSRLPSNRQILHSGTGCRPRVTMEISRAVGPAAARVARCRPYRIGRSSGETSFGGQGAGIAPQSLIVAGLETERQIELARQAGIRFGQGNAIRPSSSHRTRDHTTHPKRRQAPAPPDVVTVS